MQGVRARGRGQPEREFRLAGELGAGVLTHLVGQGLTELAQRVAIYRRAHEEAGHPGQATVTLMVHTYLDEILDAARREVEGPFCHYLARFVDVGSSGTPSSTAISLLAPAGARLNLSDADARHLALRGFERYFAAAVLQSLHRLAGLRILSLE